MQFYNRQKKLNNQTTNSKTKTTLRTLKTIIMKTYINRALLLMVVLFTVTSCEAIGDIFQAGMGVGIFIVIAVVVLIIWLISKFSRK